MEFSRKTWMSIFIAAIMILSVMGFALTFNEENTQQLDYNGTMFTRTQNGWQAELNSQKIEFLAFPSEVEDIPFDEGSKVALDGAKVLWFTYDPGETYSQEIAEAMYYTEDLLAKTDIYVQRGLLNNTGYVLPEITCKNATAAVPVLVIHSGNETKISHDNGCITASAENTRDVYRIADRILFQEYQVTE